MERDSDRHGPREEGADPEPPADDDPPRPDIADPSALVADAERRMARLRHDLEVANDSRYEDRHVPGLPDG
jgi:hypothetical protein